MTKEFDRLREVAQVDNFLAGSSQSGVRQTSPVTIAPNGQAPQRAGAATAMPKTAPPRQDRSWRCSRQCRASPPGRSTDAVASANSSVEVRLGPRGPRVTQLVTLQPRMSARGASGPL